MNEEQRQATADPQTKPADLGCESPPVFAVVYIYHRHLLFYNVIKHV